MKTYSDGGWRVIFGVLLMFCWGVCSPVGLFAGLIVACCGDLKLSVNQALKRFLGGQWCRALFLLECLYHLFVHMQLDN